MRMQVVVLLASVFAGAGISAISALYSQGQPGTRVQAEAATRVQEGVMSDIQKEHSKLYRNYKGTGKLADRINREGENADELTITVLPGLPVLAIGGRISAPNNFLNNLAADADAVVIGTVTAKASQLTENGAFIFTDYDVRVEEVLKDNSANNIQPHSRIAVTRPGGRISLQGRMVTAVDRTFKPFATGGRYLLFLKYIPTTRAYHAVSTTGVFQLADNKRVELLTEAPDAPRIDKDVAAFISDVRIAIANAIYGRQGGSLE